MVPFLGCGQGRNRTADTRIFSRADTVPKTKQEPISLQITSKSPLPSGSLLALPVGGSATKQPHIKDTFLPQVVERLLFFSGFNGIRGFIILGSPFEFMACSGLSVEKGDGYGSSFKVPFLWGRSLANTRLPVRNKESRDELSLVRA